MCRTIHKIALITNLTQSLNGFEFREDVGTGKGQYSMDGGSTWQNFSSGVDQVRFTPTVATFRGLIKWLSNNQIIAQANVIVDSTYYQYAGFDTMQFQFRYGSSTFSFYFLVDATVDGVAYSAGQTWSIAYGNTAEHIINF